MSFFPAKLKASELTCWYIKRPKHDHHHWPHRHEYNFHGKLEIIPQVKADIENVYLELSLGKTLLKINSINLEISAIIPLKIWPEENMLRDHSFQIRLSEKIEVPSHGHVVVKFNHGGAKCKVRIRIHDKYRPPLCT